MRLAIYCDYSYRVYDGALYAELPFGLFVREMARHCERLVVMGRLDPVPKPYPFAMGNDVEYAPLPYYESGAHLTRVLRTLPTGIARFWRMLDDVDTVWLLGPNPPQVLAFALLAKFRRRRVVLGVRQNLPRLIRHRHPASRLLPVLSTVLEYAFRAIALSTPVVAVGRDLARNYRHAPTVHVTYISLLSADQIVGPDDDRRSYEAPTLRMLSVGRLDPEKNPLLLASILKIAREREDRWHLDICGDGTLLETLRARLRELGLLDHATFHGYVPIDDGLWDLYRDSHALIHVSFTEGFPQVLLEAFAARLPVVATDVGGVAELASGASLLVAADDASAAADALNRLAGEPELRSELVDRSSQTAAEHTLEAEARRLAAFLQFV